MSKRRLQPGNRRALEADRRPVLAAGKAAGKDADIVRVVGNRKWHFGQIVERRRRTERRDDPAVLLGDDAERRDVYLAAPVGGRDDTLANVRHR